MVEKGAVQRAVPMQVLRVDVGPEPQENSRHFGELALVGDYFMEGSPALLADGIYFDVGIFRLPEKGRVVFFVKPLECFPVLTHSNFARPSISPFLHKDLSLWQGSVSSR